MRAEGAELVAISPQVPEKNAEAKARHRLEFPVLSDVGNEYAAQLGLAFTFSSELREVYEQFGTSLPSFNGDGSWRLPMPTRIVVRPDGVIHRIDSDPDYTHRPEPEETVAALRSLR